VVSGQETVVDELVVPHGALVGRITLSSGAPLPSSLVAVERPDGTLASLVSTNDNGEYVAGFVPGGTYTVYVDHHASGARQWFHGRRSPAQADPISIPVGQVTRVDEQLLPMGTISGRLVGPGWGVTRVIAHAQTTRDVEFVSVVAKPDGTFTMPVFPGPYKVQFTRSSALEQWASGKESEESADVFTVVAGQTIVIEESLIPVGRMQGRLTDANGTPVFNASVQLFDPADQPSVSATTGFDGSWSVDARAGTYRVRFEAPNQIQWASGKLSFGAADAFTVTGDQTTTVNETLLPTGSLTVTATDARTGEVVDSFCATADNGTLLVEGCTGAGSVEFPAIGAGSYTVTVDDGVHLNGVTEAARVVSGQATTVDTRLVLGTTFVLAAVDARTGQPVEGVCASLTPAQNPYLPEEHRGACDVAGTITVDRVRPDRYQIFATAHDGVHGSQWVGRHGGVGSRTQARVVTARSGGTIRLTIRLDGRGAIAGTITDKATGAPIASATAIVGDWAATSDESGHYRLDNLGPYEWTVFYLHSDYAGQWSGGGSNRLSAERIRVRANHTTTYNVRLRKGTTLTGQIATADGVAPDSALVTVYNAATLDVMGYAAVSPDGRYRVHVLGPQAVKLRVEVIVLGRLSRTWYDNAADFRDGRTVLVPASGTRTVDIAVAEPRGLREVQAYERYRYSRSWNVMSYR
jgi:hypothetical protein